MKLFVSPHNDDEALFGAFTILREKPAVLIVFDGHVQAGRGVAVSAAQRREESARAGDILGVRVAFLGLRDDDPTVSAELIHRRVEGMGASEIYAPAFERNGHAQHNLVARALDGLPVTHRYLTYTTAGKSIGVTPSGCEVPILDSSWIGLKLRALACYESQHAIDPRLGCWPHFLRSQLEYYAR